MERSEPEFLNYRVEVGDEAIGFGLRAAVGGDVSHHSHLPGFPEGYFDAPVPRADDQLLGILEIDGLLDILFGLETRDVAPDGEDQEG